MLFAETLAVFFVARPLNPIDTNLIVVLGAAAVLLAVTGAGRVSVDHMVVIRRREAEAADEFAADHEADNVIASLRDPDAPHEPGPLHGDDMRGSAAPETAPPCRTPVERARRRWGPARTPRRTTSRAP
ncbi:hypothetical protein [Nonomuraea recticatena]|uniref:hypothetical protein n=1 Tax=Nonomuraea recticatena TaxID=46178 RepID=UPI0036142AF6